MELDPFQRCDCVLPVAWLPGGRQRRWLVVSLLLFAAAGCSDEPASPDAARGSSATAAKDSAADRIERLKQIADEREFGSGPLVIDALDDESIEVREAAGDAAQQVLGAAVRYHAHDPPDVRRRVMASYRRIYDLAQETGTTHLIDTMPALIDRMEDEDESVRRQAYEDIKQLTGSGLRFRADAPLAERQQVIVRYRNLWELWNQPGSEVLERLRDPAKMRAYKRQRVEEIKRRRATKQTTERS